MTIAPPDHEEPHAGTAILARLLRAERPRTSLVDHMVEDIAQQIILGRLSPGADLNSVDLARHYGSSRTPVREALLTLQREGLVEIHARRRPRVAAMSPGHVRDVYQVRATLRGLVSELIARDTTADGLAALVAGVARLRSDAVRGDVDAYFWDTLAYDHAEAELAGNRRLARVLGSLSLRVLQPHHRSLAAPGRLDRSLADHERLLTAYAEHDAPLAVAIARSIAYPGYHAVEADADLRSVPLSARTADGL